MSDDPRLDELAARVHSSRKYGAVSEALVRRIGAAELAKRATLEDAVKATKNKLHQVAGLYFAGGRPDYDAWLRRIVQAPDDAARRAVLRAIMAHHASTRERLPILDAFYARVFAGIGPVRSVLDLACGLNPLSLPWMPLAAGATYHAIDIYEDLARFLQAALAALGVEGKAEARDVIAGCPTDEADVALLLKALPCLEQLDKAAGSAILDTIKARHIVVSFPTRTVGGRNVGMRENYTARFEAMIANKPWRVERIEFAGELVFRMAK
ncbi:MAG: 16S rRNA methyltransferase [Anaerolineae bacterium]|nr:16S rRNA methyltransferase [Candidatus Roseilinea sp.]MDW8451700.1 16S rRNA methyltransferase [Anaerolineae bacterium]